MLTSKLCCGRNILRTETVRQGAYILSLGWRSSQALYVTFFQRYLVQHLRTIRMSVQSLRFLILGLQLLNDFYMAVPSHFFTNTHQ